MSVPRFYYPAPLPSTLKGGELPAAAAHHAIRVLRLRVGDAVQIFDGQGNRLDASIHAIEGKRVRLGNLQTAIEPPSGDSLEIVLAQAMCGSDKMDWIVQKAVELGASEIVPVQTQRSVAKLTDSRAEKRVEHWQQIAISACEQCGRNTLPRISPPLDFYAWQTTIRQESGSKLILLPGGAASLHALSKPNRRITLFVGPEGGFTSDEANLAQQNGFMPVLLGSRILRTETAAIAGIAALQTLWGDFL